MIASSSLEPNYGLWMSPARTRSPASRQIPNPCCGRTAAGVVSFGIARWGCQRRRYPRIVEAALKNRLQHFVIKAVILGVDGATWTPLLTCTLGQLQP